MVDKGPLLTSAIIFYLSIGAAIFQILEEPNWKLAVSKYAEQKKQILTAHPCLTEEDLNHILEVISSAAGQGVTITGKETFNNWNWPNAVIFSATIITTIGYGNVAPKTSPGRVFCVFYGLFGIPLCLTWISELGKFFGSRAKRFGQFLLKKGLSLRKAQFACTAIFLLWGLVVHLVIPPFIFMYQEGWSYIEGLYFSFVTLTTIGFGDLVTGVDPNADYPVLYRYFVEMWIFLGLAWLSLFFNWNVHMVVEAHKAFKKRRRRHHAGPQQYFREKETCPPCNANNVDIFSFLSEKQEGYNDLIKQIGTDRGKEKDIVVKGLSRSKSCSDTTGGNIILTYDHSLRRKRHYSFSDHLSVTFSRRKSSVHSDLVAILNPPENKLDKETADMENVWGVKENQPLFYQEANITFTEKESQERGEETKAQFSISSENMQWVNCEEDQCSSASEGSAFTSDSSGRCRSYEQLVEKPSKEKNS
ncbi:potassium channel subfamily K member 5-like [Scleropages formosus]|uniref:Potassium channel subfamily K member 5-like n=2 Tax=Scleropages formosus TaxID=113540 RepID=A0A0P7V1B0_SCLFO|nr:potassium channel subfamily K member 5-like [Scleropages formosus]XP_029114531.1 potassium channel subfamily K member 5-like [Scleropages formosus]KPP68055.1 potassium channel subfamily K member 5-like [Scleropages formosus]